VGVEQARHRPPTPSAFSGKPSGILSVPSVPSVPDGEGWSMMEEVMEQWMEKVGALWMGELENGEAGDTKEPRKGRKFPRLTVT